ncbi:MAG: hypothetical protein IAX21_11805 [Candidatus Bathyarchaeota archaeon]|nr:hypothetical protein [Candidatus Bathyarchaeum tardum]WGM88437.1 MAG: hypothetical protein NUK63_05800 [Candidatus Bathyarchaeum tardum]WNZ29290.1 MAG: hypothetical protein IAX21_11805 [Candidatus Bathyarchaeota archaeon]
MIQYALTKEKYGRIKSFKGNLICKKCGKELKIGDNIKGNRNSGTSKLYHDECYESLFIDIKD